MTNNGIKDLINNSIRVAPGMIAVYPQFKKEEPITFETIQLFPDYSYAMNNSTVAFIYGSVLYVTAYTSYVVRVLESECFKLVSFWVPFSNGDYPKGEKQRWTEIQKAAEKYNFVESCKNYCKENNIVTLGKSILGNCMRIPTSGIEVKEGNIIYPAIRECCFDCVAAEHIGTYCRNNGVVVFVHTDGDTYLTKGYYIISELCVAGYREKSMYVPLSNGEEIVPYDLKLKWDSIR